MWKNDVHQFNIEITLVVQIVGGYKSLSVQFPVIVHLWFFFSLREQTKTCMLPKGYYSPIWTQPCMRSLNLFQTDEEKKNS
jgi:hypothetical protein